MLCIIAPEYASGDDEQRHRNSTAGSEANESENSEEDESSDGEFLRTQVV